MGATKKREPAKELRSDARDNRAKLLAAATRLFAKSGIEVGVDDVAREAGLGVGTFYRHFPTKEALFQATLVSHVEELLAAANEALRARDPDAAFFGFLERFLVLGKRKKNLMAALERQGIAISLPDERLGADFKKAFEAVLARAQKDGVVREGVSPSELMALFRGTFSALDAGAGEASRARLFEILCAGLRPPSRRRTRAT
jgi:AcrR family transcriptional regulator